MPEDKGYYPKYTVVRNDGRPIIGRTWTMELNHDPFAPTALKAYREAVAANPISMPLLLAGLDELIAEMEGTGRPDVQS